MPRMVNCVKFGKELPGLEKPPIPGELGQRVYENVSEQGWNLWKDQIIILINHYGLNMADPRAQAFLNEQMEDFFFGEGAQMPDDWVPPGQGGKGAPSPFGKGSPAQPSK